MNSSKTALISFNGHSTMWLGLCAAPVLSIIDGWSVAKVDEETLLPISTKGDSFECVFYWSNAAGTKVNENEATHLAVVVNAINGSEEDCSCELTVIAQELEAARDGTLEELAIFNH